MPAPTPTSPGPAAGPVTAITPAPSVRTRRTGRWLASGLGAAVLVTAGATAVDVRAADAEAADRSAHLAATELVGDLTASRLEADATTRAADDAARAILRRQLDAVATGSAGGEQVTEATARLREEADRLEAWATTGAPDRPRELAVADADPLLDRHALLQAQAEELVAALRSAADEAEATASSLDELFAATEPLLEVSPPASDDPAEVAAAWRSERDRLAEVATALEDVEDPPSTDLSPLRDALSALVGELDATAEEAVALLEDGDLDGYAALLDDLDGEGLLGTGADLTEARDQVASRIASGPVADVRARALGLRVELGVLRDATSQLLAS